ncbi:hypothetical protein C5167_049061 [Papaver somniferum]|uniref:Replication protein A 70 kDa DNA-binding subunit B/D first OB fold domain-containing protein n=1 Tax=Papaver somniferum TaxID=3469 RepID=A0A4Y7KJS1_PAPSO|nr:hypothetical protein C5167_049061 [Papaver somniferum]
MDNHNRNRHQFHSNMKLKRPYCSCYWEELNFTSTNDVSGVDMIIVDEQGDELHTIIPKNLIWKFDKQIREGGLYTIEKLHLTTAKPKFRPAQSEKKRDFHVQDQECKAYVYPSSKGTVLDRRCLDKN